MNQLFLRGMSIIKYSIAHTQKNLSLRIKFKNAFSNESSAKLLSSISLTANEMFHTSITNINKIMLLLNYLRKYKQTSSH